MKNLSFPGEEGFTLSQIPVHRRLHWVRLVPIYMSCMICVPLILVGVMIAQNYSFASAILIIFLSALIILIFDWMNAAVGANLGVPAAVISRPGFGLIGSRFLISILLILQGIGWYGVHISVASLAFLGILKTFNPPLASNGWVLFLTTTCIGFLFAFPNIVGKKFLTWTNYISALALIVFCIWGVFLIFSHQGTSNHLSQGTISSPDLSRGVIWVVGSCATQFVLLSDYARFCRRITPDSFFFPLIGIVPIALILPAFGVFFSSRIGPNASLIDGFLKLGFPAWGLILVIVAQWNPARVVNIYSVGLALSNLTGHTSMAARRWFAIITVLLSIGIAMAGILNRFELFLEIQAFLFPAIGFLFVLDHFVFSKKKLIENPGITLKSPLSLVLGYCAGILVRHSYSMFFVIFISGLIYSSISFLQILLSKRKEGLNDRHRKNLDLPEKPRILFCLFSLLGIGIAGICPLFSSSPFSEISIGVGLLITALAFWNFSKGLRVPTIHLNL